VHFLRWQFTPEQISSLRAGAKFIVGIDHERYEASNDKNITGLFGTSLRPWLLCYNYNRFFVG